MSFFDDPEPLAPSEPRPIRPPWAGPPDGMLPGLTCERLVLFSNGQHLLVVDQFAAYPTGVQFSMRLLASEERGDIPHPPWEMHYPGNPPGDPGFLSIGILFADGQKWSNRKPQVLDADFDGPILFALGGGGGGGEWEMDQWLWPLPPAGGLTFVVAWPAFDIKETRLMMSASPLIEAASRAQIVWPQE